MRDGVGVGGVGAGVASPDRSDVSAAPRYEEEGAFADAGAADGVAADARALAATARRPATANRTGVDFAGLFRRVGKLLWLAGDRGNEAGTHDELGADFVDRRLSRGSGVGSPSIQYTQ